MKNKNVKDEKKEKKIGLTTKIFIALLLGAVFGIVLCYLIPDSKVKNDIIQINSCSEKQPAVAIPSLYDYLSSSSYFRS